MGTINIQDKCEHQGYFIMPQVKIIRAALRELQKLPHRSCEVVNEILHSLINRRDTDTKLLKGYDELRLRRTRKGNIRVIWLLDSNGDIVLIKAGLRRDVYDDTLQNRDLDNQEIVTELVDSQVYSQTKEESLEEILNPQGTPLTENPSYQWDPDMENNWYKFIYSSYRYFPILTDSQKYEIESQLKSFFSNYKLLNNNTFKQDSCIVLQSAPGTGKTVCASLFACQVHRDFDCNVMLIVPEVLRQELTEFAEVKQEAITDNFWLGTFRDWVEKISPELHNQIADTADELNALTKATIFSKQKNNRIGEITVNDVLLYEAFVLDADNSNQGRNAIYKENQNRIEQLEKIKTENWQKALSGRKSRIDIAKELESQPPSSPFEKGLTLVIVDEAQDYLLSELKAMIAVCEKWSQNHHPTYLWFLGDLNQRIQPTDFLWSQLGIKEFQLRKNYRNSFFILEFANQFLNIASKISADFKTRKLPEPAQPEDTLLKGEQVRLLIYKTDKEADDFIRILSEKSTNQEYQRYLLKNLANAVKIISNKRLDNYDNLVILNAEQAKGREFEACVAFRLFDGDGKVSLQESFEWYTLLTRARSRLLIIATSSELNRLKNTTNHDFFTNCVLVEDADTAINWIHQVPSDIDVTQIKDNVKQRLLKRCETGNLFWDTYLALELAKIPDNSLLSWEKEALRKLKNLSPTVLNSEIQSTRTSELADSNIIPLRCLLLRAKQLYWAAIIEASKLKNIDNKAYENLLIGIAKDLKPYEAAIVNEMRNKNYDKNSFAFWEVLYHSSEKHKHSVPALCEAFTYRLGSFLRERAMNK